MWFVGFLENYICGFGFFLKTTYVFAVFFDRKENYTSSLSHPTRS